MMKRLPILSTLAALLLGVVAAAELSASAQIRGVTANPPEAGGVHELAERFERDTGLAVIVEAMGTGGGMNQLLASDEPTDVVIGTAASLDQANSVLAGARTSVGRVGIGVIIRLGMPEPAVSTADALRQYSNHGLRW